MLNCKSIFYMFNLLELLKLVYNEFVRLLLPEVTKASKATTFLAYFFAYLLEIVSYLLEIVTIAHLTARR